MTTKQMMFAAGAAGITLLGAIILALGASTPRLTWIAGTVQA
jgi:hypothetical protein